MPTVAPVPALNAAPRDLRSFSERENLADTGGNEEVAEAADDLAPRYSHLAFRHSFRHADPRNGASSRHGYVAGRAAHEPYARESYRHGSYARASYAHESYALSRAGHATAREPVGRTSFIRGPHELAGPHVFRGSKRRT